MQVKEGPHLLHGGKDFLLQVALGWANQGAESQVFMSVRAWNSVEQTSDTRIGIAHLLSESTFTLISSAAEDTSLSGSQCCFTTWASTSGERSAAEQKVFDRLGTQDSQCRPDEEIAPSITRYRHMVRHW